MKATGKKPGITGHRTGRTYERLCDVCGDIAINICWNCGRDLCSNCSVADPDIPEDYPCGLYVNCQKCWDIGKPFREKMKKLQDVCDLKIDEQENLWKQLCMRQK